VASRQTTACSSRFVPVKKTITGDGEMKVKDEFELRGIRYGYCSCGREVRKDKDDECPHCLLELEWNEDD